MPWNSGKDDGLFGYVVSSCTAIAEGRDVVHGSADFLGSEARDPAHGNVCEWEMGIGREIVEGDGLYQED